MQETFVPAQLILESGEHFSGFASSRQPAVSLGEVVFNTGMAGYVESLTDPSYAGQILVFTYPLIGNYGVSAVKTWESSKVHVKGVVMSELALHYSNPHAVESLLDWLQSQNIPFLTGADTRTITKYLRKKGVTAGAIITRNAALPAFENFAAINWIDSVSIKEPCYYSSKNKTHTETRKIIVMDCGIKENILRNLLKFPFTLKRVPYDYDFTAEEYDGVFVSNGPGDPVHCIETIEILRKAMTKQKPIFGICLGTQLMALAAGAKTYKLLFGHRSQNQPCIYLETQRCYLTSQNHSYAVDEKSLPADWKVTFRNLNDQSVEGIAHTTLPYFAVQFHPESSPGPMDTEWLFDRFYDLICQHTRNPTHAL
jgi:carbamoyl-phosphate synthase small subunit